MVQRLGIGFQTPSSLSIALSLSLFIGLKQHETNIALFPSPSRAGGLGFESDWAGYGHSLWPFQVSGRMCTLQSKASGLRSTMQGIPSGPRDSSESSKQRQVLLQHNKQNNKPKTTHNTHTNILKQTT